VIIASLLTDDPDEAARLAGQARDQGADAVEIRADLFRTFPLSDLASRLPLPCVFTLRPSRQGGRFLGPEERRLDILRQASRAGFAWIDLEDDAEADPKDFGCRVLLSHHDFEACPENLHERAAAMSRRGAAAVKIAVTPRRAQDVLALLRLQDRPPGPATIFGMGARGVATRLLGLGKNLFTYASLEGKGTAEGQPTLHDLRYVYNARQTDPNGPIYGVVGDPANHSRGPVLHNRLLGDHGLEGVYVPFELDRPEPLWDAAEELGLRGLSVTMPFKERAVRRADRTDEFTRRTGAANTLAFRKDGVHGANTDGPAVIEALENARGSVAGRHALVIGAGGAARSAALALALAQAAVTVTNRSAEHGERLAAEVKGAFLPLDRVDPGLFDVVVQATPVGMHPNVDAQPLPGARVRKGALVLEMVYYPRTTRFLVAARRAGAICVDGLDVFARQARDQFAFWTGHRPDLAVVETALAAGEGAGA